jgi:hypothetical protein
VDHPQRASRKSLLGILGKFFGKSEQNPPNISGKTFLGRIENLSREDYKPLKE